MAIARPAHSIMGARASAQGFVTGRKKPPLGWAVGTVLGLVTGLASGCGGSSPASSPTPPPTSPSPPPAQGFPTGVYSLTKTDSVPAAAVYQNPSVAGIALRVEWGTLEPQSGQYDWSYLDQNNGGN